jgi:glycosyl transferase family 25
MDDLNIEALLDKYKPSVYEVINTKRANFINTRIKKIFVINLADNVIRRNYILVLMKKYNINFSLVVVNRINDKIHSLVGNTKISKDELGCTLSHMWCLREIIKNNFENAIIFEDDIIFHKNFKELFMTIFRSDITYDFLLLGACDFSFQSLNKDVLYTEKTQSHVNTHRVKLLIENDDIGNETTQTDLSNQTESDTSNAPRVNYKNMYRPHENSVKLYGAHANYYSLEGARNMYDNKTMCISFFDKDYMMMFDKFENSAFICYPNLVITDISYSNLHHSYPFFSKSEELYYINCFDNFKFTDYNFIYLDIIFQHKGVKIRDDDTYESYMSRLIKYQFSSVKERETIKNRIVLNFFTITDLEKIRNNI